MALLLTPIDSELFDDNSYVMKVWDSVASELTSRTSKQAELAAKRQEVKRKATLDAELKQNNYIQQIRASWGDLISLASTVPAVVEQDPTTVKNDDNLQRTTATELARTATDTPVNLTEEQKAIAAEKKRMCDTCSNEGSDPTFVAGVMQKNAASMKVGVAESFISKSNRISGNDATDLASMDCTKSVALAEIKQAGKDFGESLIGMVATGTLTPNNIRDYFDELSASVGTSLAQLLGGAISGIPNFNPCASQLFSKVSIGFGLMASAAETLALTGEFAAVTINSVSNIVQHSPELLIGMAETLAQTAVNTGLMAIRIAMGSCLDKQSAFMGMIGNAERLVKGGISVYNGACKAKSAIEGLIETTEKLNFSSRIKSLVKDHPCVRSMDMLIKGTNVDIRTYMHLTATGIKYARISLGTDRQARLSSYMLHNQPAIRDTWTRNAYDRRNHTTDRICNRYTLYGYGSFSYL